GLSTSIPKNSKKWKYGSASRLVRDTNAFSSESHRVECACGLGRFVFGQLCDVHGKTDDAQFLWRRFLHSPPARFKCYRGISSGASRTVWAASIRMNTAVRMASGRSGQASTIRAKSGSESAGKVGAQAGRESSFAGSA